MAGGEQVSILVELRMGHVAVVEAFNVLRSELGFTFDNAADLLLAAQLPRNAATNLLGELRARGPQPIRSELAAQLVKNYSDMCFAAQLLLHVLKPSGWLGADSTQEKSEQTRRSWIVIFSRRLLKTSLCIVDVFSVLSGAAAAA